MYARLGIQKYTALYIEHDLEDYWSMRPEALRHLELQTPLSCNRWQGIHYAFHYGEDPPFEQVTVFSVTVRINLMNL